MANKIILVVGPQEGVGKTTLAANLAARYAQIRHQPVLMIDADPLCRGNLAQVSGCPVSPSILELLDQLANQRVAFPILRGRIPANRFQISCTSLAAHARDAERITPEQWGFFLEGFAQLYDVVIDMEMNHPLIKFTLDLVDVVVWSVLPNALTVRATAQHLDTLQNQKFGFNKFVFVLNQAGLPNSLPPQAVAQTLGHFRKGITAELPYEPELNRLLNQGLPAILENQNSNYAIGLKRLLEHFPRFKRDPQAATNANPFAQPGPAARPASQPAGPVTVQSHVVDSLLEEKRVRWNTFKQRVHRQLVEELNIRRIDLDTKGDPARERQLRTNVESTVNALIGKEADVVQAREERERLVKELVDEALGLGPLEELLADPAITEIMVNRFDQVYIERKGKIVLSDKRFIDNNHVVQVIRRIISPLGRRIDESVPMVDARLKDGSRVNAIIPPLAVQGPSITIRRFPEKALNSDDLVRSHSISRAMVDFLKVCVLTKKNMVISGGTGTGKTTILNMLSSFIPNDERIVTVEDTAELRMQQEHVVRLEARPANIEGQGQVSIRDLVKNCLRMRPDRIVVGECRGGEALDMLQAMNTGHDGSLTTIHANNPRDAFTRLETLCLMAGMDLPVWALREQIRSAVHVVVQLARLQDGSRKVVCITEVIGRDDTSILTQDLFRFVQDSVDAQGKVLGHYEAAGNIPKFFPELKSKGLGLDVSIFEKNSGDALGGSGLMLMAHISIFVTTFFVAFAIVKAIPDLLRVYRERYQASARQTARELDKFFISIKPTQMLMGAAVLGVLLGVLSGSWVVAVAIVLAGLVAPKVSLSIWKSIRSAQFEAQLMDALLLIGNSLKSGLDFVAGIERVAATMKAPISEEFGLVLNAYRLGTPLETALMDLTQRIQSRTLETAVYAINIQRETGGNIVRTFDQLILTIREESKLQKKVSAMTSQGRTQIFFLAGFPWALAVLFYLMAPDFLGPALSNSWAQIVVLGLIVWEAIGIVITKKIVMVDV